MSSAALRPLHRVLPCTPWAARMHSDPAPEKAIIGGIASGKSYAVSEDFIIDVCRWPQTQSLIMLGTYKQIKEGALKTFGARLNAMIGPERTLGRSFSGYGRPTRQRELPGWTLNRSDLSMTILRGPAAGHRIVVWSAETYESLKSTEFDRIWCDEVQTWNNGQEAFGFMQGRLRSSPPACLAYPLLDDNGDPIPGTSRAPMRLWLTANPPWSTAHWLYQRFVANREPDDPMTFYHVKTDDNTLLPNKEQYKARLRRNMTPEVYKIEVLGEWGDIGVGRAYTSFYRNRHTTPDPRLPSLRRDARGQLVLTRDGKPRIAMDDSKPIIWSQDFGVMPRASVVMQLHQLPMHIRGYQREMVYVHDALEIPNGSTDLMIAEFARRYPPIFTDRFGKVQRRKVFVYGDPAGITRNSTTGVHDWDYMRQSKVLQQYDIHYVYDEVHCPVSERVLATNVKLCNADDEIGVLFDPGDGGDDKAASSALDDFQRTQWKQGTKILDKGTPSKGLFRTHVSDCCGYAWHKMFPIVLPTGGVKQGAGGVSAR